ncbi:MAG: xanthine dehydrogenase family protein molybdopterin-binding subunit, partial [Dehalococcoidia bacterium]
MASTQGNGRRYIGKPLEKVDAREQVTGKALFGADLHVPGMLYGRVLRSPYPHARIKKLDYQKALELRGVRAVITAEDLPPVTQKAEAFGGELMIALKDLRRLVLAHDKALFDGHPIAAVAATTPEIAEEAVGLIEVEYELLPPVENVVDAMREDSLLLHEDLFTKTLGKAPARPSNVALYLESGRGDVERGLGEADVVVENTYDTKMVHQGYLEPQACLAKPKDDYSITLWTSTQGIFNVLRQLTALLELPQDKVTVVPAEIGGGFGGKIYTILEPLAILLARKSDRPVKMVMDRSEVLRATGPTSPTHVTVKVGAKKDGRLTACFIRMVYDAGAFPGAPIDGASLVCFGPYKTDNLRIEAYDVVTNKPRVQAYRAPGGTAASFAVETSMDELAERLGIDPLQFRLINAVDEGDLMTNDTPYQRIGLKEMLKQVAEHPAWTSPLQGPNRGRGLGLGFWLGATLTSSAVIMVHPDGTVTVSSGQVDLTGTRTTMRQMVAEELQLPIEHVTARVVDTNSAPYTDLSAGSRTTYTMSVATYEAAHDALRQMKRHAAHQMKVSPEEVEYADGRFWVRENPEQTIDWLEVARLSVRRNEGPVCGYGTVTRLPSAPAFAAHVADVEVDPETGRTRVVKYTSFQDVGKAINPQQVEGQIQGGATQGIGWALFEYYHYDKGVLKNASLLDYRTPTSLDLPMLDTVIVEVPSPASPYGVRGVGEVPIVPPPSAIANALYRVTGVRMRQLPMTPEAVFWA